MRAEIEILLSRWDPVWYMKLHDIIVTCRSLKSREKNSKNHRFSVFVGTAMYREGISSIHSYTARYTRIAVYCRNSYIMEFIQNLNILGYDKISHVLSNFNVFHPH